MRRRDVLAMIGAGSAWAIAPWAARAEDPLPTDGRPDYNDPRYSANAYPPRKEVVEGVVQAGDLAQTADDLNLRAEADPKSDIQTVMKAGSVVSVEGKLKNGYFPVNWQSSTGWADAKYLQKLAPETLPVTGVGTLLESTPIYDAPNATGKVVANWTAGIPISYFGETDGGQYKGSKRWYKVLSNPDRFISTWSVFGVATNGLQAPPPLPKTGPLAMLGQITSSANVRVGPGASHEVMKTWPPGRRVVVFAEIKGEAYAGSDLWYQVAVPPEQSLFVHSSFVDKISELNRVDKEKVPFSGRWIDVDLGKQVMVAYYADRPQYLAQTASGRKNHETDEGTYGTFWRLVMQRMQGDNRFSDDYYNLDAVPYIQYFHPSGEAIHGAYWHDNFGQPMSHGCVNASIPVAQYMLQWAPLGTKVVVHQ